MPKTTRSGPKIRRTPVLTRLPVALRQRLAAYSASTGLSERMIIERALTRELDQVHETDRVLQRIDAAAQDVHEYGRDLRLLSEAFARLVRMQLAQEMRAARAAPPPGAGSKPPLTPNEVEARYKEFMARVAESFLGGHRLSDDLPPELVAAAAERRAEDDKPGT